MDIIFIERLSVMMYVGIHKQEQNCLQKLLFDIEMGWDNQLAVSSDNIIHCVNYVDVKEVILNFLRNKKFALIETVAERTAEKLMMQFRLPWVRIKLSKPCALMQDINVGVLIERGVKN